MPYMTEEQRQRYFSAVLSRTYDDGEEYERREARVNSQECYHTVHRVVCKRKNHPGHWSGRYKKVNYCKTGHPPCLCPMVDGIFVNRKNGAGNTSIWSQDIKEIEVSDCPECLAIKAKTEGTKPRGGKREGGGQRRGRRGSSGGGSYGGVEKRSASGTIIFDPVRGQ